jgi:DNA-binding response OmpR family regulator
MKKILVVDDEQDLREMIHLIMQKEGFDVMMAENGKDFLEKLETFQPDLVTLDVMMPGLTTTDILEKLHQKKINPKIVLLTVVRFTDKEKQHLFEKGCIVDCLTKPFEVKQLLYTVHKHLEKNQ